MVSPEIDREEVQRWVTELAQYMPQGEPKATSPQYAILLAAIFWDDETPAVERPLRSENSQYVLVMLLNYRTKLIQGTAGPDFWFWQMCQQSFPDWVGFHHSRCEANAVLSRWFRRASNKAMEEVEAYLEPEERAEVDEDQ